MVQPITREHIKWLKEVLSVDISRYPPGPQFIAAQHAAGLDEHGEPLAQGSAHGPDQSGDQPAPAVVTPAAPTPSPDQELTTAQAGDQRATTAPASGGAQTAPTPRPVPPPAPTAAAPFAAPATNIDIKAEDIKTVRSLAQKGADNAFTMFQAAIGEVSSSQKAKAAKEALDKEHAFTFVLSLCLLPLGPIAAAAAGQAVTKLKVASSLSKTTIEALTAAYHSEQGKGALDASAEYAKFKAVTFAIESDDNQVVGNFLAAVSQEGFAAKTNLDAYLEHADINALITYYSYFQNDFKAIHIALMTKELDNMKKQVVPALLQIEKDAEEDKRDHDVKTSWEKVKAKMTADGMQGMVPPQPHRDKTQTRTIEEIVSIRYANEDHLASVQRIQMGVLTSYKFGQWITPDQQQTAVAVVKENLTEEDFGEQLPSPKSGGGRTDCRDRASRQAPRCHSSLRLRSAGFEPSRTAQVSSLGACQGRWS